MKRNSRRVLFVVAILAMNSLVAFAAPKKMPNGEIFDAVYYAGANPDVAKAVGNNEAALYGHYVKFGKAEGRVAVEPQDPRQAAALNVTVYNDGVQQVINLCNEQRAKAGLQPLVYDRTLTNAAMMRSAEMRANNYFEHARPDGRSCFTVFDEYGVNWTSVGENIALNQRSPKQVVDAWMNSPGHRANIMKPGYRRIGVGFDNYYWTQLFAN